MGIDVGYVLSIWDILSLCCAHDLAHAGAAREWVVANGEATARRLGAGAYTCSNFCST